MYIWRECGHRPTSQIHSKQLDVNIVGTVRIAHMREEQKSGLHSNDTEGTLGGDIA